MKSVKYTGTNYEEIKALCGDKVLAPYFCMGFSMLSLMTEDGFVTVHEGDTIVQDDDGKLVISNNHETEEETEETADYRGGLHAREPQGGPDGRDCRARETGCHAVGAPQEQEGV
jgi:hypothetical protein